MGSGEYKKSEFSGRCSERQLENRNVSISVKSNMVNSNRLWDELSTENKLKNPENCDGVVPDIYLDYKFQWPQKGLNCESLAYEVVT